MKFRSQLILAVGTLIVITTTAGVIAVIALQRSNTRAIEVARAALHDVESMQALRLQAEQVVSAARGYLLSGDPLLHDAFTKHEMELQRSLKQLHTTHGDAKIAAARAVTERRLVEYSDAMADVFRLRTQTQDIKRLARAFDELTAPRREALHGAVLDLVEIEREALSRQTASEDQIVRAYTLGLLFTSVLGVLVSVGLAWVVIRKLNRQYRRVQEAEAEATLAAEGRKQILDTVAHDLLSPLNAIVLALDVSEAQKASFPHAGVVKDAAERMRRLVTDLLDVSRAERTGLELERDSHDVTEIVRATADQFSETARRRGIHLQTEAEDVRAFVDRDRVMQVFSNLVGNALKFAHKGDEITIGAAALADGQIRFYVTDTGPGIPKEEIDQLFAAYKQGTGRARRNSLGLGLHICKTLVEAHGGTIGVETAAEKGSTFWFVIPPPRAAAA